MKPSEKIPTDLEGTSQSESDKGLLLPVPKEKSPRKVTFSDVVIVHILTADPADNSEKTKASDDASHSEQHKQVNRDSHKFVRKDGQAFVGDTAQDSLTPAPVYSYRKWEDAEVCTCSATVHYENDTEGEARAPAAHDMLTYYPGDEKKCDDPFMEGESEED